MAREYFVAVAAKWFFDELAKDDGPYEPLRAANKEIRLGAPLRTPGLSNRNWEPNKPIPELNESPGRAAGQRLAS